tara:strand:- start:35 stop:268 length:234 start_codon:yes stop_codon:yes gene_type:complete
VNDTTFCRGDLVYIVGWAEKVWFVGEEPQSIAATNHPLAGKRAIFLLTHNHVYAMILGENGIEIIEKSFLRLKCPSY